MYNFNTDGSGFKLQIKNEKYYVNEKKRTVTVKADVTVSTPEYITNVIDRDQLPNGFDEAGIFEWDTREDGMFELSWTAKCAEGDVFDVEKGKKIAIAHLEANAYNRVAKSLTRWLIRFRKFINIIEVRADEFIDKANSAAEHDLTYIDSIS
jgi:hypothetical protein